MDPAVLSDSSAENSFDSSEEELEMASDSPSISKKDALAFLAGKNIAVHDRDSNGVTELMVAACESELDVVKNLLAAGAEVNCSPSSTGDSVLILAASRGHGEVVEALLRVPGIELETANRNGDTALMLASSNNYIDVATLLLKHGADVNQMNQKRGYNALLLAADYGLDDMIKLLVAQSGIELNATNSRGDTALILAAAGRHRHVVKVLLEQGADMEVSDIQGYTALKAAVAAQDAAIVELFLEKDQELTDSDALSALPNAFRMTINDLAASRRSSTSSFAAPSDPLQFFEELCSMITDKGDSLLLLRWLHGKGLAMACAKELASLLAPASVWASNAARGSRVYNITQQRLIYCLGAMGQLATGAIRGNVLNDYRQAGISGKGLVTLTEVVDWQLATLAEMAANAAAQLGSNLVGTLIARCLAQTSAAYEVHQTELQDILIQEGFLKPLATAIASGWKATVAEVMVQTRPVLGGLSLFGVVNHVHTLVTEHAERALASTLKENIRPQEFVHSLEKIMPAKNEEVIHGVYQTQQNWLWQFCQQSCAN